MTKQCIICEKKSISTWKHVKLRGKYNPTVKYKKYPNIQWVNVPVEVSKNYKAFAGKRIKACAKCIKAIGKGK
jgi:hypothetical protein